MKRVLLAVGVVLSGCANETAEVPPPSSEGPSSAPLPAGPTVICAGLEDLILVAHPTRDPLRARFGEPDSTQAVAVPNRHVEGATDTLFTIYYPGLVAGVHKPSEGGDLADLATVTDNRYVAIPSVGIGTTREALLTALGEPYRTEADALAFWCGEGAEQPVIFELADGRVRAILVDFYVD